MTSNEYEDYTVSVFYDKAVVRYLIPPVGITNKVRNIDFYLCNRVYSYDYPQVDDSDTGGVDDGGDGIVGDNGYVYCILPIQQPLDISRLIDLPPSITSGKTVVFNGMPYIVDANGIITILIDDQGQYTIDTSHIRTGTEIYIDSTNAYDNITDYQNAIPVPPLG